MSSEADFDSILCIGTVDWWYHNRGHFDLQVLQRLRKRVPVLYINSIGMRMPRPGKGNFLGKIKRKLQSFSRGLQKVDENFWVYSPVTVPSISSGVPISQGLLNMQVKHAMKRLGFKKPMYWVGPPTGLQIIESLPEAKMVYQCTDRYEFYPGVDRKRIADLDVKLRAKSDLTIFCSAFLYDNFGPDCKDRIMIDHGVDYENFVRGTERDEPEDVKDIPHPRIGFVGGMNKGVFDPDFFVEVAKAAPDLHFVMVGGCAMPEGWCPYENVHFLGKKPLEEVPAYMGACDVLAMYWSRNEWIEACNPIKNKEYLAVGKPVVSTPFYELKNYEGYVRQAGTAGEFIEALRTANEWFVGAQKCQERVKDITWDTQADKLWQALTR